MPAVTQTAPDLLGGVSKQTDDKKRLNQVSEALNVMPDPTFGMLKRNGLKFSFVLKKDDGTDFEEDDLKDAAWFFVVQGERNAFFGCIKDKDIHAWDAIKGNKITIDNQGGDYLTGTKPEDYHFRTIQDVTYVTNKLINAEISDKTTYEYNRYGTVILKSVEYGANYSVRLNNDTYTYKTRNADDLADDSTDRLDANEILSGIKGKIPSGTWDVTVLKNSLEIKKKDGKGFTLGCIGGIANTALECFQDEVGAINRLPIESIDGRWVKISNYIGDEDDYYVKFDTSTMEWKEAPAFETEISFKGETLPHELIIKSDTEMEFKPAEWKDRLVGDDETNPTPSFVGHPIRCTFFYNNRFGMLSEDNVIMSVANDPFNFWHKSALTQVDSDPIDVQATSVRPTTLFGVLPSPQGLQLFARRQQFILVSGQDSVLTPSNVTIRSQSAYEMYEFIEPEDMGTRDVFVSRVPAYTRMFTMQQRGFEETPIVIDASKVVTEWIPDDITLLGSDPQNSMAALASRHSKDAYIYKFYNNGEQDLFQSWVQWKMPGSIQAFNIVNDMFICVTSQGNQYTSGLISINDVPLGVQTSPDVSSTPCLDLYVKPTVTYDDLTNITTFDTGYNHVDGLTPIMVWTPATGNALENQTIYDLVGNYDGDIHEGPEQASGYWTELDVTDGNFTLVGDWTEYANNMIVGYKFDYEVELPKFYYYKDREGNAKDYTARLNISRVKFAIGKTGAVTFKLKAQGSDEWVDIQHVSEANYYLANTAPVESEYMFTVPVHQNNMNFNLKVTSDLPYPVSLVSMTWEGQYTPRFYRRT